jgi:hypothetical protein
MLCLSIGLLNYKIWPSFGLFIYVLSGNVSTCKSSWQTDFLSSHVPTYIGTYCWAALSHPVQRLVRHEPTKVEESKQLRHLAVKVWIIQYLHTIKSFIHTPIFSPEQAPRCEFWSLCRKSCPLLSPHQVKKLNRYKIFLACHIPFFSIMQKASKMPPFLHMVPVVGCHFLCNPGVEFRAFFPVEFFLWISREKRFFKKKIPRKKYKKSAPRSYTSWEIAALRFLCIQDTDQDTTEVGMINRFLTTLS